MDARGLQRDVVYLSWPIAPSYSSPNARGWGGGVIAGSQPMSTAVHITGHGANKLWRSTYNGQRKCYSSAKKSALGAENLTFPAVQVKRWLFSWKGTFSSHSYKLVYSRTLIIWNDSWATFHRGLLHTHAQSASIPLLMSSCLYRGGGGAGGGRILFSNCSRLLAKSRLFRKLDFSHIF